MAAEGSDLELDVYPLRDLYQAEKSDDNNSQRLGRDVVEEVINHGCCFERLYKYIYIPTYLTVKYDNQSSTSKDVCF